MTTVDRTGGPVKQQTVVSKSGPASAPVVSSPNTIARAGNIEGALMTLDALANAGVSAPPPPVAAGSLTPTAQTGASVELQKNIGALQQLFTEGLMDARPQAGAPLRSQFQITQDVPPTPATELAQQLQQSVASAPTEASSTSSELRQAFGKLEDGVLTKIYSKLETGVSDAAKATPLFKTLSHPANAQLLEKIASAFVAPSTRMTAGAKPGSTRQVDGEVPPKVVTTGTDALKQLISKLPPSVLNVEGNLEEMITMIFFQCAKDSEKDLKIELDGMKAILQQKKDLRARIQAVKEDKTKLSDAMHEEYNTLVNMKLIAPSTSFEDFEKARPICFQPSDDPNHPVSMSLGSPSWVKEPNAIPLSLRADTTNTRMQISTRFTAPNVNGQMTTETTPDFALGAGVIKIVAGMVTTPTAPLDFDDLAITYGVSPVNLEAMYKLCKAEGSCQDVEGFEGLMKLWGCKASNSGEQNCVVLGKVCEQLDKPKGGPWHQASPKKNPQFAGNTADVPELKKKKAEAAEAAKAGATNVKSMADVGKLFGLSEGQASALYDLFQKADANPKAPKDLAGFAQWLMKPGYGDKEWGWTGGMGLKPHDAKTNTAQAKSVIQYGTSQGWEKAYPAEFKKLQQAFGASSGKATLGASAIGGDHQYSLDGKGANLSPGKLAKLAEQLTTPPPDGSKPPPDASQPPPDTNAPPPPVPPPVVVSSEPAAGFTTMSSMRALSDSVDKMQGELDSLSEQSEPQQIRMQMYMDRRSKAFEMLSNLIKKISETSGGITKNYL